MNSHSNTIQNVLATIGAPTNEILCKYNVIYYFNSVLEGSAMSSCDYPNPFWVSIFKNKNLEFPWFDFAHFLVDTRSNTYLLFKLSEFIRTSPFSRYSPMKFAYQFSCGKFAMSL